MSDTVVRKGLVHLNSKVGNLPVRFHYPVYIYTPPHLLLENPKTLKDSSFDTV